MKRQQERKVKDPRQPDGKWLLLLLRSGLWVLSLLGSAGETMRAGRFLVEETLSGESRGMGSAGATIEEYSM